MGQEDGPLFLGGFCVRLQWGRKMDRRMMSLTHCLTATGRRLLSSTSSLDFCTRLPFCSACVRSWRVRAEAWLKTLEQNRQGYFEGGAAAKLLSLEVIVKASLPLWNVLLTPTENSVLCSVSLRAAEAAGELLEDIVGVGCVSSPSSCVCCTLDNSQGRKALPW